jgi:CelD/BcsL family acetyltransferase involved in cellulose biosynthesis
VQFGLRCGPVLAGWHLTYNTALPGYSPGLIQILHLARAAAARGIHRIDMGRGAAGYKAMFSSQDLFVAGGEVVRRSSGAALYSVRYGSERGLRRFVREHPRPYSGLRSVRGLVARASIQPCVGVSPTVTAKCQSDGGAEPHEDRMRRRRTCRPLFCDLDEAA